MSSTPQSIAETDLSQDPRWQLLQRIAGSPQFQKSARLRDFLTYVVAETLRGRTALLSEHHIGCGVFGRSPDYSPSDDNIVRVHARQLRLRLEEYFLVHGKDEPLFIEIPKGSYVPVFRERSAPDADAPPQPPPALPSETALWDRLRPRFALLLAAVFALSTLVLAVRTVGPAASVPPAPWLLAALMDPVEPTTVVIPDSGFGALRSTIGDAPPLTDYLDPGYPNRLIKQGTNPEDERWIRALTNRPYTTFPTVVIATRLAQLAERHHWKVTFRFARHLNSRDFNEGRFLLIGGAISNPWVSLFEKDLAFRSDWDQSARLAFFRNVQPRPGERPTYAPNARNGVPGESFGAVSLAMSGTTKSAGAKVLIIQGVNIESTEAAAEFVFDTKMSYDALRKAGGNTPAPGSGYRFEALLRTKAVTGASRDTELAATRYTAER